MILYRIAKKKERARDLSGQGAASEGGRWNSEGIFALYTSESRALAMLELLVHVDETELPPNLFVMTIEVENSARFYEMPDGEMPDDWRATENLVLKQLGDEFFKTRKYIGVKVRRAVMPRNTIMFLIHYSRVITILFKFYQ
ncbi:RES family NAD+ phosphorylase [Dyadobacter sp. CY345]|uniref:RES family NAD+ phosphorylase n=1 Tax=Dyadobacter sp. CY345 TaxID=2909335 RepID=UPI001F21FE0C|nr:RES family NAD+ phosphorylase [Dyadobacter sp. CY345]MCF2447158.1 RES family NAD+ phosphorylase [Dyadobacter sp. CY345]